MGSWLQMDWLDERIEKWKEKIKKLSLKKSLILYIMIAIATVILLYLLTINLCDNWYKLIANKYNLKNTFDYDVVIYYRDYFDLHNEDRILVQVLDFVKTWSINIYSLVAIIITSIVFYNHKINEPLTILMEEANYISNNDLTFDCRYDSKDELGDLCFAFDKMRINLIDNNQRMWNMMEEQKTINAAFAHDLRTPLTVIQGYMDLLLKYYPEGKISDEKLVETLSLMKNNLIRLEKFADTMKEINKLDDIEVKKEKIEISQLMSLIEEGIHIFNDRNGITIECNSLASNHEAVQIDITIFMEILENLLSNALRFTKNRINITIEMDASEHFILYVKDDGPGFQKDEMNQLTKQYYTSEGKDAKEHFGIGLTICEILCRKHGGHMGFANSTEGGAIVSVSFSIL